MFEYLQIVGDNYNYNDNFFKEYLKKLGFEESDIIIKGNDWDTKSEINNNVVDAYKAILEENPKPAVIFIVGDDACDELIKNKTLDKDVFHYAFAYGGILPEGFKFFRANYSMEQIAKLWRLLFQKGNEGSKLPDDIKGNYSIVFRSELNCNEIQTRLIKEYLEQKYKHLKFLTDWIYNDNICENEINLKIQEVIKQNAKSIWVIGVGKNIDKIILEKIAENGFKGVVFSTEMHNHFINNLSNIPEKGFYYIVPKKETEIIESVYCRGCLNVFKKIFEEQKKELAAAETDSCKIANIFYEAFRQKKYFIEEDSIGSFSYNDFGELSSELIVKKQSQDKSQEIILSLERPDQDIFSFASYVQDTNLFIKNCRNEVASENGTYVKYILDKIDSTFCKTDGRVFALLRYPKREDLIFPIETQNQLRKSNQLCLLFNLLQHYIENVKSINEELCNSCGEQTGNILSPFPIQINCDIDEFNDNECFQIVFKTESGWMLPCQFLQLPNINNIEISAIGFKHGPKTKEILNCDKLKNDLYSLIQFLIKKRNNFSYIYLISDLNSSPLTNGTFIIFTEHYLFYPYIQMISTTVHNTCSTYIEYWHMQRLRLSYTKSALASIMSRNGSHNIGSHVLSALSHNVGTMPDDRVLYQYIQHRMDYIATAATDFPSWTYSTKFVGGLVREFLSQYHLLEYISKSEGLQAFKFQDLNHGGRSRFNQNNTIRLHVRRIGFGLPDNIKEVPFIEYSETEDNVQWRLQYDIDAAIPGGVIGGHAFFTILENLIRNAAKHGWATKKDAERKENNLDIYIDFEQDNDYQNLTVKVYDGISDVFSMLGEANIGDANKRDGINKIKNWIKDNEKKLCEPLSKESLKQLTSYLDGKSKVLPEPYCNLLEVLNKNVNENNSTKVWEVINDLLTGQTKSEKELGHRLWIPLHHSQQIKLATPFIDDSGALRRGNWGLAEMKISAGYLQMRSISEIGGLDDDVNGYDGIKKIITPICVKHVVHKSDNQEETRHCLGYEFKIRCPRELLFVVKGEKPSGDKVESAEQMLLRHGVHIRYINNENYKDVFALQNKSSHLEWDFRYVILPTFPIHPNPNLPFRVLTGEQATNHCVPHLSGYAQWRQGLEEVLKGSENAEKWAFDLKQEVYRTWLSYWQIDRRKDIKQDLILSLVVDIDSNKSQKNGSNKGGECLISDSDLWKAVLDNLFRTLVRQHLKQSFGHELEYPMKCYLAMMAVADTREMLRDFDTYRPRYSLGRQMAFWFDNIKFQWNNDNTRESLVPLVEKFMKDSDVVLSKEEQGKILAKVSDKDYIKSIFEFHDSLKVWVDKCKNAQSYTEHDFEAPRVKVNDKFYNYPGFHKFIDSCQMAFEHSSVFLRKYEEHIVTLPESFQSIATKGNDYNFVNAAADVGISAVTDGTAVGDLKAIRYERHFDVGAFSSNTMVYAEPLSGTQTYLNTLGHLASNPECSKETIYSVAVSLMENALARILIIDERTADFLRQHSLSKRIYAHMGVWVLDDKTVEGCASPRKQTDGKEWYPDAEQSLLPASEIGVGIFTDDGNCEEEKKRWGMFDIVIVHQGLIDKWLPKTAHDSFGIEGLLEKLKERVPYVVITTGRGTPSNTPISARILPFSVIEKTMFRQSPEKMILVDTVMNVLPVGERKQ